MKIIYPEGSFSQSPVRSAQTTKEERAADYKERALVAMDRGDFHDSAVYFEWARLELLEPQ